jgi:hypothetical protein
MGLCGSLMQILISHDSWPDKLSTKHKINEGQKMNLEWRTPKLLDGLNCESKREDNWRRRNCGGLSTRNTSGVEGRDGAAKWNKEDWQAIQSLTRTCTNQITSWLVHSCSTLVPGRATSKHELTRLITA